MRRYRQHILKIWILFALLLWGIGTSACGGFFCTNVPVDQSGERIIFTINGDGTITAITGIAYSGPANEFSWLVPLPSVPDVDVAETETLDLLQQATEKTFTIPPNPCQGLVWINGGMGGGGGGAGPIVGNVGPYDYAILDENDPELIVRWLRSNGYNVQDVMIPAIEHYVQRGMVFLAMKLSQNAEVGDIQPVVMTYRAEKASIPLILTSVAAVQDMPVLVWIFGDTQYVPENYAHPRVDFREFRAPPEINNYFSFPDPGGDYILARNAIQDKFDGKAFITEFAAATNSFDLLYTRGERRGQPVDDPMLVDLMTRFKYVTRLRAQLSPEQMTLDPSFVAAPGAQPVSLDVNLNDFVDPLNYWGCTTRELMREDSALLEKFTEIEDVRIGYPANWQLSTFTVANPASDIPEPVVLHVFSPEVVTEATIRAYLAGETTPPMFVQMATITESFWWSERQMLLELFGVENYSGSAAQSWTGRIRYALLRAVEEGMTHYFNLMTTQADWQQNQALYTAMLGYVTSYPYYAHPDLLHTVFLTALPTEYYMGYGIYVGYPEGWIERTTDDALVLAQPEQFAGDTPPIMQMHFLPTIVGAVDATWVSSEEWIPALITDYGLDEAAQQTLLQTAAQPGCSLKYPIVSFEHDGKQGYLGVAGMFVLEASAPTEIFADYQTVLQTGAESFTQSMYPCG